MCTRISEISIYPIKSLGTVRLHDSIVARRGLELDRRFMLVDGDGMFLTQRGNPSLACISIEITATDILVGRDGKESLQIPLSALAECFNVEKTVEVWQSSVSAFIATESINSWFSEVLQKDIYLAYMPDASKRTINKLFDSGNDIVSFADAYPVLLANSASLQDLNDRMEDPVPMDRFRPNLVVEGAAAFEEDKWKRVRIGDIAFRITKPSARCVVTTIDQNSGEQHSHEPLKTLATFRKASAVFPFVYGDFDLGTNDVLFGTNLVPETEGGRISIGDELIVID